MIEKLHRETLAEQVITGLMKYISDHHLKPGDALPAELTLAADFGVSRQVIREALKTLQGQHMLEIVNGKGTIIRPVDSSSLHMFFTRAIQLDDHTIVEIIEARKGIEMQSAMLAAERHLSPELQLMQSIVAAMEHQVGNRLAYGELDLHLHLAIARATHNAMIYHLIESMRGVTKDTIMVGLQHRADAQQLARVQTLHRALLDAIAQRDSQAAAQVMVLHFDEAIVAVTNQPIQGARSRAD